MSRTYDLVCLRCKKALWIAQGLPEGEESKVFYSGDLKTMPALKTFLFSHEEHELQFINDEKLGDDIEEVEIE